MFNIYWSTERTLLEDKIKTFKEQFTEVEHFKNINTEELVSCLLQISLFEYENYIFENFEGSWDDLAQSLEKINLSNKNICITALVKNSFKLPSKMIKLINNKNFMLLPLDNKTKKTFLRKQIEENGLILTKNDCLFIERYISKSSEEIIDLISCLALYQLSKPINLTIIMQLLPAEEYKNIYFDFFANYLNNNLIQWLTFFDEKTQDLENLKLFIRRLCFQVCEFKIFLHLRKMFEFPEVIIKLKKPEFYFFEYEKIYNQKKNYMEKNLNNFMFNLLIFIELKIFKIYKNSNILKHFLLVNRI